MDSFILKPFSRVSISNLPNALLSSFPSAQSKICPSFQFEKPKFLPISCKSARNSKPIENPHIYNLPASPLCLFLPALLSIRDFASSGVPNRLGRWVSAGSVRSPEDGEYVRSGGIGMVLLGTTSLGKVGGGISPFLATLFGNPTFVSGLLAWAFAQSMKMFLNFLVERKWNFRLLVSSGGMPSSHSALCMALTTSVALCHGAADSLFPVCLGFSLIVMYDAIGVRRHAGLHAEILNKIVEDLFQGHPISQRKLKVLLGHTPSQVIAGALLGILISCICCQGFIVAV